MKGLFILFLSGCVLCVVSTAANQCVNGNNGCSCKTDDGKEIDLSSLGNKDGTPAFKDMPGPGEWLYSYNPCYAFTEQYCTGQSVCQIWLNKTLEFPIGDTATASFDYDGTNNRIIYSAYDPGNVEGHPKNINRTTIVTLKCDPTAEEPKLLVLGELRETFYYLNLTTKCACPGGCSTTPPPSIGKCTGEYGCSCETENGDVIDLSSIGNKDKTARFRNIPSQMDEFLYSYNPCYPFDQLDCMNAAVCIETKDQTISYVTGDYSTATFEFDGTNNHLVYWAPGENDVDRKTDVELVCDPEATSPRLEVKGENPKQEYYLIMTTKCACPGGCGEK